MVEREPARSEARARPTTPVQSTFALMNGSIEPPPGPTASAGRSALGAGRVRPGEPGWAGTGWPTTTRTSTAPSSATPASSGGPRASARRTRGLLGDRPRPARPGGRAAAPRRALAGCWSAGRRGVRRRRLAPAAPARPAARRRTGDDLPRRPGRRGAAAVPRPASFDVAFSAYGAVPFVADAAALHARGRAGAAARAGGGSSA